MPKVVRIKGLAGQQIIIDPDGVERISRTVTSKTKDLQSTYITGTYVEPTPPPDPTPDPPPDPTPDPPPVVWPSFQAAVDGTPAGGTLDLTGQVFGTGGVINKDIGLKDGTVRGSVRFAANGIEWDGPTIIGPMVTPNYAQGQNGLYANGAYTNITIKNALVSGFGDSGIFFNGASDILLDHCEVTDCGYGGIFAYSTSRVRVLYPIVRRIQPGATGNGNAYGIVMSLQAGPPSADWLVENGLVEDVPTWHGLDTHGGQRITFRGNTIRRAPRPIFITTGGATPTDILIEGNHFETAYPANPRGYPYATNVNQAFVTGGRNITFRNNTTAASFNAINNGKVGSDTYYNYLRDYGSGSINVVSSGNTIV